MAEDDSDELRDLESSDPPQNGHRSDRGNTKDKGSRSERQSPEKTIHATYHQTVTHITYTKVVEKDLDTEADKFSVNTVEFPGDYEVMDDIKHFRENSSKHTSTEAENISTSAEVHTPHYASSIQESGVVGLADPRTSSALHAPPVLESEPHSHPLFPSITPRKRVTVFDDQVAEPTTSSQSGDSESFHTPPTGTATQGPTIPSTNLMSDGTLAQHQQQQQQQQQQDVGQDSSLTNTNSTPLPDTAVSNTAALQDGSATQTPQPPQPAPAPDSSGSTAQAVLPQGASPTRQAGSTTATDGSTTTTSTGSTSTTAVPDGDPPQCAADQTNSSPKPEAKDQKTSTPKKEETPEVQESPPSDLRHRGMHRTVSFSGEGTKFEAESQEKGAQFAWCSSARDKKGTTKESTFFLSCDYIEYCRYIMIIVITILLVLVLVGVFYYYYYYRG